MNTPAGQQNRPTRRPNSPGFLFPDDVSYKRSVKTDFDITMNLGVGAFGVVKKATLKSDPSQQVAVKSIKKADCKPEELFAEVKLLRLLVGYAGIVQMYAVYESLNKVNIVMELISGGELFDAIIANEFYSEQDAGKLIKQIVTTVDFLHTKNIVHRDLKPENLLFRDKQSQVLKLIDFGIATIMEPGKVLMEVVGSRTYMAPEIHMRCGYGKPVDAYAIGVIMYILLCGYPPFDYDQGIYNLAFNSPEWDDISSVAKEMIANLLQDDQTKRLTAAQLCKHPWVSSSETLSSKPIHHTVRGTIKSYRDYNKLVETMKGTRRGNPAGKETDNRRASIFGMFNIVKETKELESQNGETDFGKEDDPSSKPRPGPGRSNPVIANPNPPRSQGAGTNQQNAANQVRPSKGPVAPGQALTPDQEAEMIQRLKNDLRNHGKSFNKLKQDLIKYSKATNNEQLRRHLIKSAEDINHLTNSYKETFDVVVPALNKGLVQVQTPQ